MSKNSKKDKLRTKSYVKYLFTLKNFSFKNLASPKPLKKLFSERGNERLDSLAQDISQ